MQVRIGHYHGSFQGRMIKEKRNHSEPWFTQEWLRSKVLENTDGMPIIFDENVWKVDLVLETVPTQIKDSARLIWKNREKLLRLLDGMSKTVCHFDIWPPNLFARSGPSGQEQTIIIDWSSVGWGVPGEDIGNLIPDSILSPNQIRVSDLEQFEQVVIAGYLRGLQESDWEGDKDSVFVAYVITTFLAWGLPLLKWILEISSDKEKYEELSKRWGLLIQEIISLRVIVIKYFLINGMRVLDSI
ncbi:phosphotransferase family protein [Paenibacillus cymbidii]|uniref:phosphotransferase family protein n=1 Tax=Paenibacillus cymbidii TaxID=1639034 RepID=UPI001436C285|nr:phosphotransferase [Paenibacillus cymbidii]